MTPRPVTERTRTSRKLTLALLAILLAIGAGVVWWLERSGPPQDAEPVLTPEAKAYTANLKLDNVEMKATDNALGQTLVEILGRITNTGGRAVRHVELTCLFYDPYGVELWRERVAIVRARDGALQQGESRRFRLPFDSIPDGWNQVMPRLVIAQIQFD